MIRHSRRLNLCHSICAFIVTLNSIDVVSDVLQKPFRIICEVRIYKILKSNFIYLHSSKCFLKRTLISVVCFGLFDQFLWKIVSHRFLVIDRTQEKLVKNVFTRSKRGYFKTLCMGTTRRDLRVNFPPFALLQHC